MILVTGANGVVGGALCAQMLAKEWDFKTVSRSAEQSIKWDLHQPAGDEVLEQLNGLSTLVHCAPIWLLPNHLEDLHKIGIGQMIVFSSTSAISKQTSQDQHEQHLVELLVGAENTLQKYCSQQNIALTIFRPAMIYGYGRDQNIMQITRFIRRFGFALLAGRAQGLRQPVHADDLVSAVFAATQNPVAMSKTYNLAGAEKLSYRAMVDRIFLALGKKPRVVHLPVSIYRLVLRVAAQLMRFSYTAEMANRMNQNLSYDNSPAHADFGYQPQAFLQVPQRDLIAHGEQFAQREPA